MGYRETMKSVLASKQDIIDYRSDRCRRKYYMLYPTTPRSSAQCAYCGKVFEMINSKQKFCSHECYIKNRFWSREDAEQLVDALMAGEKINLPQWLRDKLKERL